MTSGDPDREAGFALAESVAVLALSALVLLTLLIAADLVSRNSTAAARRASDLEMLATGLAAVRRDVEGALYVQSAEPGSPLLFFGDTDSLGIVLSNDTARRDNRESLVRIEARYGSGEGALLRSSAPLLPTTSGFNDGGFSEPAPLAVGPWRYRFSYADIEDASLSWATSWSSLGDLPAAVRLEVLDASGRPVVPSLTVRVHVNAVGCADQPGGCETAILGVLPGAVEEGNAQSD